jgi:hypothetical protein
LINIIYKILRNKIALIALLLLTLYSLKSFSKIHPRTPSSSISVKLDSNFTKLGTPVTAYVISDRLEVFKIASSANKNKIESIQFLDSVKIIAQLNHNVLNNQWSFIEYGKNKKQGYVKTLQLTYSIIKSKSYPNFAYFIKKLDLKDSVSSLYAAYLTEVLNKKIKKSHFIDSFYNNMELNLSTTSYPKFPLIHKELVFVKNMAESCGAESIEKIFIITNHGLTPLFKNFGVNDAGTFTNSKDIYFARNQKFHPITSYAEAQSLDSIPNQIKPYLDSGQYFLVIETEKESTSDRIAPSETNFENSDISYQILKDLYTIYSWKNNQLIKKKVFDFKSK